MMAMVEREVLNVIEWKLCDDDVMFYRSLLNVLQITSELIIVILHLIPHLQSH